MLVFEGRFPLSFFIWPPSFPSCLLNSGNVIRETRPYALRIGVLRKYED